MRHLKILAVDLMLVVLATLGAVFLRDNLEFQGARLEALQPYFVATIAVSVAVLFGTGANRTIWRFSGFDDYRRLFMASVVIVLLSVAMGFAWDRLETVPRALPFIQWGLLLILLIGGRALSRARQVRRRTTDATAEGMGVRENVLVVGLNAVAELFIQAARESTGSRVAIAGVLARTDRHSGHVFRGHRILGTPENIADVVRELDVHGISIDRIVVTGPFDRLSPIAQSELTALAAEGRITLDCFAERLGFASLPKKAPAGSEAPVLAGIGGATGYWRFKRAWDVVLASMMLLGLAPLLLLVTVMTAVVHGAPILFWQQRPGRLGVPFNVYKFRSLLAAHDKLGQRLPDDLRITWFGRFMRATRIDELPQLVNILRGDMSFIGPRPLLPHDQSDQFKARLAVRPGLTGWAQVNGGKIIGADDKMALDLWYIRNASLWLDLKIIALTLKTVIAGERENNQAIEQAWAEIEQAGA